MGEVSRWTPRKTDFLIHILFFFLRCHPRVEKTYLPTPFLLSEGSPFRHRPILFKGA